MKLKLTKKLLVAIPLVTVLIISGIFLFRWNQYLLKNNPEALCRKSNGGWAPAFMDSGELQTCDGKRLPKDSPLIDGDGFTCYCHKENTCWDGRSCVSVKSK